METGQEQPVDNMILKENSVKQEICSSIDESVDDEAKINMEASIEDEHCVKPLDITCDKSHDESFKKPALLIGPRRGKPGKLRIVHNIPTPALFEETMDTNSKDHADIQVNSTSELEGISKINVEKPNIDLQDLQKDKQLPLPYREPNWGGQPEQDYKLEVLKSGVILETHDLTKKSFHVFGRLPACDISLAHPTISRYHAVLQFRAVDDEKHPKGFYLYDLGSTHGTFWNGNRIRPNTYARVQGGHMIRFGCSQRKFILQAPPEDVEEESELSLTELKEKRRLDLEERARMENERKVEEEEAERLRKEQEENEGIDWGMAEDADEETDLTENPYASTNNEELFLDDPKKTLRGWFEREGYDLQYQTEDKGIGQFLCWVELPIDNVTGRAVRAEALVKGKKKESVIQCALEACRILDRHGLLRQATHEARKRKVRNWEEEDYYDSDEDNFLDRTGSIEKKREQRMRIAGILETKVETYSSLLKQHTEITQQIKAIEKSLHNAQMIRDKANEDSIEDALDAFMSDLKSSTMSKSDITKLKLELQNLRKEEARLIKLVNIAKPANLPSLTPHVRKGETGQTDKKFEKVIPMVGHTKKLKPLSKKSETKTSYDLSIMSMDTTNKKEHDSHNDDDLTDDIDNNTKIPHEHPREKFNDILEARNEDVQEEMSVNNEKQIQEDPSIKYNDNPAEKVDNDHSINNMEDAEEEEHEKNEVEARKKKNRNLKRTQVRTEKAAKEIQKAYEQDMFREGYSMWIPPQDQSGDGKTNLNQKYGY
ncbi:kanadaptin [Cephus cinctus]|uniref:Kanadaptin n=1 Tax=Cephus cinctus TaxID=211228 RepID=A0AAJ7C633_CEPCN|nr:kanadaptin [Cephus cinctus]XP_015602846.1 kanadaptin [Cephus cinctus]